MKTSGPAFSFAAASSTLKVRATSSLTMVPSAAASSSTAPVASESASCRVSSGSTVSSGSSVTLMVCSVMPGAKVIRPLAAV